VAGAFADGAIARELEIGYGTAWTYVRAMEP
jgi:molybdenum-dependent DNA-binding transcriptional regulator ModE